jgi:hypothetical protein
MSETNSEYKFRLFSYFAMAVVSIAILVGLVFLFQHTELNRNQNHVLENQVLLKQLINDSRAHEDREEMMLGHNTETNIHISKSNSERLDLLLDYFNITNSITKH